MTSPRALSGLSDIAADYDVLLCDVWGVIHNGRERFPEACAALERFAAERGPVILISNSPRPSSDVELQLDQLEVPRAAWTTFVTSGDATRALLKDRAPGPAWRIGPDRDNDLSVRRNHKIQHKVAKGSNLFARRTDAPSVRQIGPIVELRGKPLRLFAQRMRFHRRRRRNRRSGTLRMTKPHTRSSLQKNRLAARALRRLCTRMSSTWPC